MPLYIDIARMLCEEKKRSRAFKTGPDGLYGLFWREKTKQRRVEAKKKGEIETTVQH
jgi:hypothetical protein